MSVSSACSGAAGALGRGAAGGLGVTLPLGGRASAASGGSRVPAWPVAGDRKPPRSWAPGSAEVLGSRGAAATEAGKGAARGARRRPPGPPEGDLRDSGRSQPPPYLGRRAGSGQQPRRPAGAARRPQPQPQRALRAGAAGRGAVRAACGGEPRGRRPGVVRGALRERRPPAAAAAAAPPAAAATAARTLPSRRRRRRRGRGAPGRRPRRARGRRRRP